MDKFEMYLYNDHEIGNPQCPRCYYHREEICNECNEGLIHYEYNDENWDGDVSTIAQCDRCKEYV